MKFKKAISMTLASVLALTAFTACSTDNKEEVKAPENTEVAQSTESEAPDTADNSSEETGSVFYLNFKPEIADQWTELAKIYTEETGVPVKVQTAAAGTYEQILKSEVAKSEPPTLFQINGPIGYKSWENYTLDLSDTALYENLLNKEMAISNDSGVYGIPYVVEGYGIIYNDEIMQNYFALDNAKATSVDEINNFAKLEEVVTDMQSRKDEIGIDGVFASTSFATGEDWRWHTHLANVPVYYEYADDNVGDKAELEFTYSDEFQNIFDLYINNSTIAPTMVSSKSVNDSMAEFALGKVAMVQNGNWGWGQISGVEGNTVLEENVKFLPIYTGVEGEEAQGLAIGTENFFAVNSKVSEADQKATIDFVEWVFSSEIGKNYVTNEFGFIAPFNTFGDDEKPVDPLAKEIDRYMSDSKYYLVSWNFTSFPSQTFKDNFGASLLQYAQGQKEWSQVVEDMKNDWAYEKSMIN